MNEVLQSGHILKDRYRIERKIGEGEFPTLYRTRDTGNTNNANNNVNKPQNTHQGR